MMPTCAAARHSSDASPVGSVAAISNSICVVSGNALQRSWNPLSTRSETSAVSGNRKPPASRAGRVFAGNSSNASGLPRASAMIRSRTSWSSGADTAESSSSRESASHSPFRCSWGRPANAAGPPLVSRTPKHHDQPLGVEAPRHEGEHLRGCLIQPLSIVDEAKQWPMFCGFGEETERRQPDEKPVRRGTGAAAQRDTECLLLRLA